MGMGMMLSISLLVRMIRAVILRGKCVSCVNLMISIAQAMTKSLFASTSLFSPYIESES